MFIASKKAMKNFLKIFFLALALGSSYSSSAKKTDDPSPVSAPETHPLHIVNTRPLVFSSAFNGDPAEKIDPDLHSASQSAEFLIQGKPFQHTVLFILGLPVLLRTPLRHPGVKVIQLYDFQSLPAEGIPFRLNSSGSARVSVGATRGALAPNQAPGAYRGIFFLNVIYL